MTRSTQQAPYALLCALLLIRDEVRVWGSVSRRKHHFTEVQQTVLQELAEDMRWQRPVLRV